MRLLLHIDVAITPHEAVIEDRFLRNRDFTLPKHSEVRNHGRIHVTFCQKSIGRDKCNGRVLINVDFSATVDGANQNNVRVQRDIVQWRKHGTEPIAVFGKMEFTMRFQIEIRRISAEQLHSQFLFEIHRPVNEDRDVSK